MMLGEMKEGESLQDVVGPLGIPTELDNPQRVCVIGGGVGCAIAYPQAKLSFLFSTILYIFVHLFIFLKTIMLLRRSCMRL